MEEEKIDAWKSSFRDVYKRSPTSADYSVAPNDIKALLKPKSIVERDEEKQVKRGMKRSNFESRMMEDEQFSPIKKRVKIQNPNGMQDEFLSPRRTSPRKKFLSSASSPTKTTPQKSNFSPRKNSMGASPFGFEDFSPLKSYSGSTSKLPVNVSLTPIKSPTKRPYQRHFSNKDFQMLLLPTPEKLENDEPAEEFDDETNEEVTKARANKPAARRLGGSSKNDQNFQKINLRKKQFVRGKVTAEQKRKMKRKQMFRKKP